MYKRQLFHESRKGLDHKGRSQDDEKIAFPKVLGNILVELFGQVLAEEDDVAFDDLDPNEKYQVLQHLYEEYQKDPDNFPEEQRVLLEQELKELFEQGEFEGDEEGEPEDDDRMKMEGHINYPKDLPAKDAENEESLKNLEDDED